MIWTPLGWVVAGMRSGLAVLAIASVLLSACASTSAVVVDSVPTWLGGLPKDVPPRPGTPEYDAWQIKRAEEAATPKSK